MKKCSRILSVILAFTLVFCSLPFSSADVIPGSVNSIEALVSINGISNLVDSLVTKFNDQKNDLLTPLLRFIYLAANNEQINAYIGTREVSTMGEADLARVLVTWLDNDVLPDLQEKLDGTEAIKIINDSVPGLQVKIGSVQDAFDTISQLDSGAVGIMMNTFGDLKDLDVSAIRSAPRVSGNEAAALKAVIQFLKDNLSLIKKTLNNTLDLNNSALGSVLTDMVKDKTKFLKDLPLFVKSLLYKLIDKDAEAGKFEEGKMGGDWANSAYKGHSADQLLAAALLKWLNGDDKVVSTSEADKVLGYSFYEIIGNYAQTVFNKLALDPINKGITNLNAWIAKEGASNTTLKNLFKSTIPGITSATFNAIFTNAKSTGLLGQLNNILYIGLQQVLSDAVFKALALTADANTNLNANLTKIVRYVAKLAKGDAAFAELLNVADSIGNIDPDTASLNDAYILFKPILANLFRDRTAYYSQAAVNSAKSNKDLVVLAAFYTATGDWMNLGRNGSFDFTLLKNKIVDYSGKLKAFDEKTATNLILEAAADIAIGSLQYNAKNIHFTLASVDANWEKALIQIENWALDFVKNLPNSAKVHNLRGADNYGPFYKVNVILNDLVDFSFLNNVNSVPFKLDLEVLIKDGLIGNLYDFDLAGLIGILTKNTNSANILNQKPFNATVIKVVDRILSAQFGHSAAKTTGVSKPVPAEGKEQCTHTVSTHYEYCKTCGAYYAAPKVNKTKLATPTHSYVKQSETKKAATPTAATCNFTTTTVQVCSKCGDTKTNTTKGAHKWVQQSQYIYKCSTCGFVLDKTPADVCDHVPGTPVENHIPATCTSEGFWEEVICCTLCGNELSRDRRTEPRLPHTPGAPVRTNVIPSTCTVNGSYEEVVSCSVCGTKLSQQIKTLQLDENNHNYSNTWTEKDENVHVSICLNNPSHVRTQGHVWNRGYLTKQSTFTEHGEKVYTCKVCGAEKSEELELLPPMVATDALTHVQIIYIDKAYNGEITVKVEKIETPRNLVSLLPETYTHMQALDITPYMNGKKTQPNAPVTVSVPVPENLNTGSLAVFHVKDDGSIEKMNISVQDGVIRFETDSFSTFAAVDTSSQVHFELGKVDSDNKISAADARLALRAAVGLENILPFSRAFSAADVDNNGKIDASDARKILRAAVGLEHF